MIPESLKGFRGPRKSKIFQRVSRGFHGIPGDFKEGSRVFIGQVVPGALQGISETSQEISVEFKEVSGSFQGVALWRLRGILGTQRHFRGL